LGIKPADGIKKTSKNFGFWKFSFSNNPGRFEGWFFFIASVIFPACRPVPAGGLPLIHFKDNIYNKLNAAGAFPRYAGSTPDISNVFNFFTGE
jgi:hypothetical protein